MFEPLHLTRASGNDEILQEEKFRQMVKPFNKKEFIEKRTARQGLFIAQTTAQSSEQFRVRPYQHAGSHVDGLLQHVLVDLTGALLPSCEA